MPAFVLLGLILGCIYYFTRGTNGFIAAFAAWVICLIPILVERVAVRFGIRKKTASRGLIAFPSGLLQRFTWTLAAASLAFLFYADELGVSFWIAILVFYQAALAVRTKDLLDGVRA